MTYHLQSTHSSMTYAFYLNPTCTSNMANPHCRTCLLRVQTHSKSAYCTLCHSTTHIKCLNLYSDDDIEYTKDQSNNWTCPKCLSELFPFYHIDERADLLSLTSPHSSSKHLNLDHLIFDPYDLNEEGGGVSTV